ncbi:hypothetical protein ACOME3_002267 [Neoechinorhynchus agilis]
MPPASNRKRKAVMSSSRQCVRSAQRKARGKELVHKFNRGLILKDMLGNEYVLGSQFSKGGCGLLYEGKKKSTGDPVAIKLEPKINGPLFCEMHFYTGQMCKAEYRFLVLPRFGDNVEDALNSMFPSSSSRWSQSRSLLSIQILHQIFYGLWYIHSHGFVHADVKGSNIVFDREDTSRVYLIDFGLASKYIDETRKGHIEYVIRPKNKHEEYTSEDRHLGVRTSRRSDLEVLCYVLVDLVSYPRGLSWLSNKNHDEVMQAKIQFKANTLNETNKLLEGLCPFWKKFSKLISDFCKEVFELSYDAEPKYQLLSNLMTEMAVLCNEKSGFESNTFEPIEAKSDVEPSRRSSRLISKTPFAPNESTSKEISEEREWTKNQTKRIVHEKDIGVQTDNP